MDKPFPPLRFLFAVITVLLAAYIAVPEAKAEDWTLTDKALATVTTATLLSDWRQTQGIAKQCGKGGIYEINPILGHCPRMRNVNAYFAGSIIGTLVLSNYLSGEYRKVFLIGVGVTESVVVKHNKDLGLVIFTSIVF